MKLATLLTMGAAAALLHISALPGRGQTVEAMPPVVIKTVPEAGATDVAPGTLEIRVTFSKEMKDQAWSFFGAWEEANNTLQAVSKPRYEPDQRTFVIQIQTEPDRTYGFWVNSEKFHHFQDKSGKSAIPYLLVFRTKAK